MTTKMRIKEGASDGASDGGPLCVRISASSSSSSSPSQQGASVGTNEWIGCRRRSGGRQRRRRRRRRRRSGEKSAMQRSQSRRIFSLGKSFESQDVHFVSVAAVGERDLAFDLTRRNEAHGFEMRVETVDDRQLLPQDVFHDVAHRDVVRHADVVADDLESSFAGDGRHLRCQSAGDAEAGATGGEPKRGAIVVDVVVIIAGRLTHLNDSFFFGRREMVHVIAVDDFDGMPQRRFA